METIKRKRTGLTNFVSSMMVEIVYSQPTMVHKDEELLNGRLNECVPMVVWAKMANYKVQRILVDQGSSIDVMFLDLLTRLGISEEDLTPYRERTSPGLIGLGTTPLGHIELAVTYGERPLTRTVKTPFPVLPGESAYNCKNGRPNLGQLVEVASTVHLK